MAGLGQQLKASDLVSKIDVASFIFQTSHTLPGILAAPLRPSHPSSYPPNGALSTAPQPPRATWFCPGESGCKGQTGLPPAFQLPLGTQLSAGPREPKVTSQPGPHNWYIVSSETELLWALGQAPVLSGPWFLHLAAVHWTRRFPRALSAWNVAWGVTGGGSCGKVQAAVGGPQVSDPRNLASASPACRGHSWALSHIFAGWLGGQTDGQRYEGERQGRKGEGDPQAVLQGLSTPCGGRRTKGGGSPAPSPPGLLCLLDKLLLLTVPNRAICGEDKGWTHAYLRGVNAVVSVLGAREETPSSAVGVKKGL